MELPLVFTYATIRVRDFTTLGAEAHLFSNRERIKLRMLAPLSSIFFFAGVSFPPYAPHVLPYIPTYPYKSSTTTDPQSPFSRAFCPLLSWQKSSIPPPPFHLRFSPALSCYLPSPAFLPYFSYIFETSGYVPSGVLSEELFFFFLVQFFLLGDHLSLTLLPFFLFRE